jgi:hypothetical protein
LSYGYWMREQGWSGYTRMKWARADLLVSFSLVLIFCLSMMFLATQVEWQGPILDEGPRLCLLLADRIGAEIGPIGRTVFLFGFWGTAFASVLGVWHGVPFLFDDWLRLYVASGFSRTPQRDAGDGFNRNRRATVAASCVPADRAESTTARCAR